MKDEDIKSWIKSVITKTPSFLNKLKDEKVEGRYKYSLSGDINIPIKWGLGNTIFATKTYYMLNRMELADNKKMISYIKLFQSKNTYISDSGVQILSFPRRIYTAMRSLDLNNIWGTQTKRAETRQSFAALSALGGKAEFPFRKIPYTKKGISQYIHSLNWSEPWGAASHFSHLIFFLNINDKIFNLNSDITNNLLEFAFKELETYRRSDGMWYKKGLVLPDFQKVNGGMKIMTAFANADNFTYDDPIKIIDLCFGAINSGDACNHLNVIYLLYNCTKKTDYRSDEIILYTKKRLELYKEHWWNDTGGFSFFPRNANKIYYGAYLSKGFAEPDVHGTHLFLWGIVLICKILGWNEFKLQTPLT
ncbi:MAG: hypothetical protein GY714_15875 [Desulfobacterales bacterium]|nr:hypothetical protein [Desulfobacterales bacterium]